MREILFRGKDIDGIWREGSYCTLSGIIHRIYTKYAKRDCGTYYPDYYAVIPETVGQYTGLTDENGTKIFEGDIISIPFEKDRSPWEENCIYYKKGEVYFCAEHHGWFVRFYDGDILSIWKYNDFYIDVIGNIHDNPELIKGV